MIEHVKLYDNQKFQNCVCSEEDKYEYSIKHSLRPMPLPKELIETIEMLLWYSPNNLSSNQAFENKYLNNPVFEDAIITYYLRYLEIQPEDVCFVIEKSLPESIVSPYLNATCRKCTKIIVAKSEKETKIASILRHLRNCLAHGNFNLLSDNDFIGFDEIRGNYTAVFKLQIVKVYNFCEQLIKFPDFTISNIFQYILMKDSYSVIPFMTGSYNYRDNAHEEELVFAIKPHHAFRINCSRYTECERIVCIETIDEYSIEYDKEFNRNVHYIDLYYCENENELVREVSTGKYVMSLKGLEALFSGDYDILDSIETSDI